MLYFWVGFQKDTVYATERKGKMKKRLWALILAITLSLVVFPVSGNTDVQAATTYVCHILTSSTKVYSNTRLSRKQGTVSQSQEITIYSYNNSYARIRYKSGRKNKYGYIKRSSFLTTTKGRTVKPQKGLITYYRQSTKARYGNFTTNMAVTVYGTTGSYTQVSYKTPAGKIKFALIRTSDAKKYLTGTSSSATTTSKTKTSTAATKSAAATTASATSVASTSTVSSSSNASSSKRQSVVSYMRSMATIRWTPSRTITYWNASGRKWVKGTVYTGIPYSQYSRTTSLEEFRRHLSGSTYTGPSGRTTYKGTDCSSSVSLAWKQANSSIGIRWTGSMTPGNSGIKKVGSYVTNSSNTKRSCTSSGQRKMYAAYRQLQPGDAVVTHGSNYHVRLVTSVSSNGITCIEQSGLVTANRSSWKVNQYYSFASLYNSGYVPITMTNW